MTYFFIRLCNKKTEEWVLSTLLYSLGKSVGYSSTWQESWEGTKSSTAWVWNNTEDNERWHQQDHYSWQIPMWDIVAAYLLPTALPVLSPSHSAAGGGWECCSPQPTCPMSGYPCNNTDYSILVTGHHYLSSYHYHLHCSNTCFKIFHD